MLWTWWVGCTGDESEPKESTPDQDHSAVAAHSSEPTTDTEPPAHSAHSALPTETALPPLDTFRAAGPYTVDTQDLASTGTSCRSMAVSVYTPVGGPGTHVVVVAHGFAGRRDDMEGWGAHLASWGLTALVPTMCHASPLDVDHRQNGLDLVALAAEQAPGQTPFYVGYSAGGLAAMVAATEDPGVGGHLGLDMVDAFNIGVRAAPGLTMPAADLFAEPSACNSRNNGLPLYDGVGATTLGIPGADHCDWNNPYQASCDRLCATGPDEPRIGQAIATLVTSWVLWQSGLDPRASEWWLPGEEGYEQLVSDGWITP
jgi:hypothetical protein